MGSYERCERFEEVVQCPGAPLLRPKSDTQDDRWALLEEQQSDSFVAAEVGQSMPRSTSNLRPIIEYLNRRQDRLRATSSTLRN